MTPEQKLGPGKVLGRYELLLPIAQGGMATVWAARQKGSRGFQKTVAIKTMLPTLSDDPQFEQMFLDEAALAARIHHPNVAEILDLGEEDEVLYIVMEWVDGESLSVLPKAAKKQGVTIPQRVSLRIGAQACAGLHAAHELRDDNDMLLELVHRDVSPQNILVTFDGVVKLVDFGVAKAVNRAGGETTAGQLKGKIPYMSPEQARGGRVDRRTDIFAMGIVLYKMTTGIHPFIGENDLVTMRNIISRPVLPPRAKSPEFPSELEQLLLKCLQKDPDKRFQTMVELERGIEEVLFSSRGTMPDDDVSGFIRLLMGERGQRRRLAIRDAVRMLDERPEESLAAGAPLVHDAVSDVMLTRMKSGVTQELPVTSPSQPGGLVEGDPRSTTGTDVAMGDVPFQPKRTGILVAAAAVGAVMLVGLGALLLGGGGAAPQPPVAAAPVPTLAPTPEPPPQPKAVLPEPVDVAALPDADTTEASVKPDASTKPVLRPRSPGVAPTKPEATTAPTTKPPAWVPSVQNPGF